MTMERERKRKKEHAFANLYVTKEGMQQVLACWAGHRHAKSSEKKKERKTED